jgi:hypothetical protein
LTHFKNFYKKNIFIFVPRLGSGFASKPKNLAFAACGYLQGITVSFFCFLSWYLGNKEN